MSAFVACGTNDEPSALRLDAGRDAYQLQLQISGRTIASSRTTLDGTQLADTTVPRHKRKYASAHFDFDEATSQTSPAHRREIIFAKDAGVFIVADTIYAATTNFHFAQEWNFAGDADVDHDAQRIRARTADGASVVLYHTGPRAEYSRSNNTNGVQIIAAWNGSGTQTFLTLIVPSPGSANIVQEINRSEAGDSAGFDAVLTNGDHIVCLASAAAPVSEKHLGVRAEFVLLEGLPGQPTHGILLGAKILPAERNQPPPWSSIQRAAANDGPRAQSVTLPQDCEICVSESFEVIAPISAQLLP